MTPEMDVGFQICWVAQMGNETDDCVSHPFATLLFASPNQLFDTNAPFFNDVVEIPFDDAGSVGAGFHTDRTTVIRGTEKLPQHPLDHVELVPDGVKLFGLRVNSSVSRLAKRVLLQFLTRSKSAEWPATIVHA
jgi:hypothetical protein